MSKFRCNALRKRKCQFLTEEKHPEHEITCHTCRFHDELFGNIEKYYDFYDK